MGNQTAQGRRHRVSYKRNMPGLSQSIALLSRTLLSLSCCCCIRCRLTTCCLAPCSVVTRHFPSCSLNGSALLLTCRWRINALIHSAVLSDATSTHSSTLLLFRCHINALIYSAVCQVAHQYTSPQGAPFEEITNHSCLNSWLGGNIAPRPLDVARFAYTVFGTDELIDEASRKEMLTLHPMTDVFGEY